MKRGEPYDAKIAKGEGIEVYMFRSIERKLSKYNHIEFKEKLKVTNSRKKCNKAKGFFRT